MKLIRTKATNIDNTCAWIVSENSKVHVSKWQRIQELVFIHEREEDMIEADQMRNNWEENYLSVYYVGSFNVSRYRRMYQQAWRADCHVHSWFNPNCWFFSSLIYFSWKISIVVFSFIWLNSAIFFFFLIQNKRLFALFTDKYGFAPTFGAKRGSIEKIFLKYFQTICKMQKNEKCLESFVK